MISRVAACEAGVMCFALNDVMMLLSAERWFRDGLSIKTKLCFAFEAVLQKKNND